MGNIIDDKTNDSPRCSNVKLTVVWVSLICTPITLLFLIFCIIKMIKKKDIPTLTTLILLIFFGEVVQCISKLLQILKYIFKDRAIICQIQIVLAIYADYCSLVCTLLLSIKCFFVLKYKNKHFISGKQTKIIIIIFTIIGCLTMGVIFLFIDHGNSINSTFYSYDKRDYCSYWCWLRYKTSVICYGFYWAILIANIVLSIIIYKLLNRKYRELSEENEQMMPNNKKTDNKDNTEGINKENNDSASYSNQSSICSKSVKLKKSITNEERMNDLMLIKIKCKIYPLVTIIIWAIAASYRLFDDILMYNYNKADSEEWNEKEKEYFREKPNLQRLVQALLIIMTILTSTRGLFYGISFIVFEEKMFGNFVKRFFRVKSEICMELKEGEEDNENNEEESNEEEECNDEEENNEKGEISARPSTNDEMNTSEVRFVEE